MKTKSLTIYRPENIAELEQVPKGGYIVLFNKGLHIYGGLKDRRYQFVGRGSETARFVIRSTNKENLAFNRGVVCFVCGTELSVWQRDPEFPEVSKLLEGKVI